jgi:hypothetical protein
MVNGGDVRRRRGSLPPTSRDVAVVPQVPPTYASITGESHLVCSTPCSCWIHKVWLATVEQTN